MAHSGRQTERVARRRLSDLAETPELRRLFETSFPGLWDRSATGPGGVPSRREFLKLMGASLALAGLTGCRWPKETIVPATHQPVDRVPGVPVQYATAIELAGVATGLLVTSYDGRPIKIEGNDQHPFSRGKTSAWMQASILDLYDPDRSTNPVFYARAGREAQRLNRTSEDFAAFAREHFAALRTAGGAGLAVLAEPSSSPTLGDAQARFFQAFPQARWYAHDPLARDNEIAGARLAFGASYRTHLHLDKADVIVSLDNDFLMTHPAAVRYAADFAARRRAADGTMSRLYVFESNLTVTGAAADQRYPVRPSQIPGVLERLCAEVGKRSAEGELAQDLLSHRGRCVIVVGPQQPPNVHAMAHALNAALGAVGRTITYTAEDSALYNGPAAPLAGLTQQIESGAVTTLLILGGDPVRTAPPDLDLAARLAQVPTSIHLGVYRSATSGPCAWHLPQAHFLESWSDARAWDGSVSIVQPLIEPLYGGRTAAELLAQVSGDALTKGYDLVRRTFAARFAAGTPDVEAAWKQALHDGVVAGTAWPQAHPQAHPADEQPSARPATPYELHFAYDSRILDGRSANNAWLQEMPDPITKLTWGNAALLSPTDAAKIGVKQHGDIVKIELDGRSVEIPAYILPGHVDGAITLPLGYGRSSEAGQVAAGVGVDVNPLRRSANPYIAVGAKVTTTGRHHELALAQDPLAIQSRVGDAETQQRVPQLVREATLTHYKAHPRFAQEAAEAAAAAPLWQAREYNGHKWGLAIDLSACIGCGACVVACQAENNVPVVGPDEVRRGRDMHWLRVDRYFREGTKGRSDEGTRGDDVRVAFQPMMCVHCENAPCEQVCPVAATVHDEEGLNLMVYNRCVGTRYCSNNCPFKVRRFNWFYNHHGPHHPRSLHATHGAPGSLPGQLTRADLTDLEKLVNNPNVTVRSRGVMEKCTYCVQRIKTVTIRARNEGWSALPDGLIVPACAQACPTDAIVFGDLNDPHSRVRKLHDHNRAYTLLDELNVKPRTKYLARLRNPLERLEQ
jgi:molybdopterin-containing oxidoreductase family iron-sulfur binding subunit